MVNPIENYSILRLIEIDIFIVWKYLFSIENIPKLYLLANFAKNENKKAQFFLTIS